MQTGLRTESQNWIGTAYGPSFSYGTLGIEGLDFGLADKTEPQYRRQIASNLQERMDVGTASKHSIVEAELPAIGSGQPTNLASVMES